MFIWYDKVKIMIILTNFFVNTGHVRTEKRPLIVGQSINKMKTIPFPLIRTIYNVINPRRSLKSPILKYKGLRPSF